MYSNVFFRLANLIDLRAKYLDLTADARHRTSAIAGDALCRIAVVL
jgi:hypothetical protein